MSQMIYPTTNLRATEQLVIERGEGVYVYDDRGRRYLEGMSGLWCAALGYGNEEVVEVAAEQMRTLSYSHLFGGKTHPAAMTLADQLSDMVPINDARVFLGSSGSDANDTQIKLLRYYFNVIGQPQRYKIISRERAYHGVTVASASLTGIPSNHAHFNLPFDALGILRTGSAHFYRDARPGETENEFANRRANELEELILAEGPETIAAFIAEPISGAGGVIVPPADYFDKIQSVLGKYDILMWDDEVICGFGRTGADFGATRFGINPQAMSLAKAMSSAYLPVSAAIVSGDIYSALVEPSAQIGVFGHGYTYGGHPVACAVASKVIEIYRRDRIFESAATTGMYLQERLREFSDHPLVGEVRGVGLIAALELVADKVTREPFTDNSIGAYCAMSAQEQGLIVRALGGNNIALCPPLVITNDQVDELMEALGRSLDATMHHLKSLQ